MAAPTGHMRTLTIGVIRIYASLNHTGSHLQRRAARRHFQRFEIELLQTLKIDPGLQFLAELSREIFGERGFF
jgi:hypothetical protein